MPESARLVEYSPATDTFTERGDVVTQLKRAGLWRDGGQQAKIHSKIVEGPDRWLYFASMDESGEREDGTKLPTWGGHLWRMNLTTYAWQHLLQTKEALIAVGTGGGAVYALGYFGHVLYRYDTRTGSTRRLEVGSVDGHISRNVLVDGRGHVYVPRLTATVGADGSRRVRVALVEFDSDLVEIHETTIPNEHYLGNASPTTSHGIVGLQTMADGVIYFTTHAGFLGRVTPPQQNERSGAAEVVGMGWFHPEGSSFAASLFTPDGEHALASLVQRAGAWEWVSCDLGTRECSVAPLVVPGRTAPALGRTLLYGSSTRDNNGGHYVVGIDSGPVALRVQGPTR
jgi:hypothetical protein